MVCRAEELRILFECNTAEAAQRVVASLYPLDSYMSLDRGLHSRCLHNAHSVGRFVYVGAKGCSAQVYKDAKQFVRDQQDSIALISVTAISMPWDAYNLQLLEHSDTECFNVPLFNKARENLVKGFLQKQPSKALLPEELWEIVSMCCLQRLPAASAHNIIDNLCGGIRELEARETVESVIIECEALHDIYRQFVPGGNTNEGAGLYPMWRIMVHLLERPV